jgi:GMP synthase (glutamine-hydrolysing)
MQKVLILDFGSQYTQLIARKIRELGVYSEILPFATPLAEIRKASPSALVLSGGPQSVYGKRAPHPDKGIFDLGVPILGICYGVQLILLSAARSSSRARWLRAHPRPRACWPRSGTGSRSG